MDWRTHCRLALGVCCNHSSIDTALAFNLMRMEKPSEYVVIHQGQHIKAGSLNGLVDIAREQHCDKILFMDSDMEFPTDTIPRLMKHNQPIVSGLYHLKTFPFSPVAGWNLGVIKQASDGHFMPCRVNGRGKMWKTNYYPLPANRLVHVHWVGIGCLLVDMDVFTRIPYPPFYDDWDHKSGTRLRGHDLVFCDAAMQAGYNVMVDTSVDCGHRTMMPIDKLYVDAFYESKMYLAVNRLLNERMDDRDSRQSEGKRYNEAAKSDGTAPEDTPEYWNEYWRGNVERGVMRSCSNIINDVVDRIPRGSSVGDLGCGDGHLMSSLKSMGYDVTGYDFSKLVVDSLNSRGMKTRLVDVRTFTPPAKVHHTVIMSHLLEHMEDEYEERAIRSAAEMATDQVIIVVPEEDKDAPLWHEHVRKYDEDSLRSLLTKYFGEVHIYHIPGVAFCGNLIAYCSKYTAQGTSVSAAA